MAGFRSGIVTTHLPMASQRRVNAASESLYARPPVATAHVLTTMSAGTAFASIASAFAPNFLYIKRLSKVVDRSNVLRIRSYIGETTGTGARVVFSVYRIDAVNGTGGYSGYAVPELHRVWSYVVSGDMALPAVVISPPPGVSFSGSEAVDRSGVLELIPSYDYAFGVGFDVALTGTAAAGATLAGVPLSTNQKIPLAAGWSDAPDIIRVEDLLPSDTPYMTEVFMNSSLTVPFY